MILHKAGSAVYFFSLIILFQISVFAQEPIEPKSPRQELQEELNQLQQKLDLYGHEEINVFETNLKEILQAIINTSDNPSPLLYQCYKKLNEGAFFLTIRDLVDLMPEIIDNISEPEQEESRQLEPSDPRAPRQDAPSPEANNAIVGCGACDLTQVLSLLSVIKKRIQQLQILICDKFEQTWTILDNLIITATVDFSEVFTVLDEILDCCNATFTVLD
ncbi:MAG: hypothetical protein WDZ41_01510, partial [Candidatus Babeliales bacterium]